jgi:AraC-like DNA-binding protein
MDPLSAVLGSVRLNGAIFFHAEFTAPWRVDSPRSENLMPVLSPGSGRIIIFHLLVEGSGWAKLDNGDKQILRAGDIVILPHGDAHLLANGNGGRPMDPALMMEKIRSKSLDPLRAGGGGEPTRLICGFMTCDPALCQPLFSALPPALTVHIRSGSTGHWLENSIRRLVEESNAPHPGSHAVLSKLSEALFIEAIRLHLAATPAAETGWLAGARDPHVGRCLAVMHSKPGNAWTIADLARQAGLSRSVLMERFHQLLGEPPMAYLTRWRMQIAARALSSTTQPITAVAAGVGYESEAAFNRAFKRQFGIPPARYRKSF